MKHPYCFIFANTLGLSPSDSHSGGSAYCLRSDGQPITLRMGLIDGNSRANTTLPQ